MHLAQKGAGRDAGPRVRAMLHTREAWAYAALGRATAFQRATNEAIEALADAEAGQEPYWIAYFDSAELAGVTGGRLLPVMALAWHTGDSLGVHAQHWLP